MKAKLGRAAVLALTAVVGFVLYRRIRDGDWWVLALVPVGAIMSFGLTRLARRVVARRPAAAVWLAEGALVGIIIVGGAVAVGLAALGGYIESLIVEKDDDVSKAVAKTIGGAVGTVGAVLFLDDLDKETGSFWPSVITQKMFQSSFERFQRESPPYEAVWSDRVVTTAGGISYDFTGWGFRARLKRAAIIKTAVEYKRVSVRG